MSDGIKNFDDIIEQHRLNRETVMGIRKRLAESMNSEPSEVKFTGLQAQAFNTKGFWLSDRADAQHIIVQGATSAGKTLISEMAILDTLRRDNKFDNKCIVLVPLRAMVRERWRQLRRDLGTEGIYASSSDYQDHDGEIIEGKYTVAVIVYEKFFSMLSQSQDKMLKNCGLLVVDELQMLGKRDRGPKLEIAIQKVLRNNALGNNDSKTRIMCLTTSDCEVEFIKKWLTIDGKAPIPIVNPTRPTSLLEYVIQTDGKYQALPIYGEDGIKDFEPYGKWTEAKNDAGKFLNYEGEIEVPDYVKSNKEDETKQRLLKALLKEIYRRNPRAKVLIFVNGRPRTLAIAKYIADNADANKILPRRELTEELQRIELYEGDDAQKLDYQKRFRSELFPRAMACHNASMSTALREYVEGLFGDANDPLLLVAATETLTIGMNMPVDVMILYDNEIPRTKGSKQEKQPLSSQEYKNFVGRAGRLGQGKTKGGQSFIFATDKIKAQQFWDHYVNCTAEEITSSLTNVEEKILAPYYLNLLNTGKYADDGCTTEDLKSLWQESFACSCRGRQPDSSLLCEALAKAKLCKVKKDIFDDDDEIRYRLTGLGISLAPYALNLKTCNIMRKFFFEGVGLPSDTTKIDLEPEGYLLDVLYTLCKTPEIKMIGQLKMPQDNHLDELRKAKGIVEKTLKKMARDKDKPLKFLPNSPLKALVDDSDEWSNERENYEYLMRAIILWHWTQGKRISQIRRETGFDAFVALIIGDIARLAETVAYQLEAVSIMLGHQPSHVLAELKTSDIYRLSTRVNYGVPHYLVCIANKHVYKLERKTILDIGDFFEQHKDIYRGVIKMLREPNAELRRIIPDDMRKELLKNIDESNERDDIDILLKEIKKDNRDFTDEMEAALKNLFNAQPAEDEKYLLPWLDRLFFNRQSENHIFDADIELDFTFPDKDFAALNFNGQKFFLIERTDTVNKYYENHIKKERGAFKVILLATEFDEQFNEFRRGYESIDGVGENLLAMKFETFAGLLAQAIGQSDTDGSMLMPLLMDACGEFNVPLKTAHLLLQNYTHHTSDQSGNAAIRLICDRRRSKALEDLKKVLDDNRIAYRELSWGEELRNEDTYDEPTLLFLRRSAVNNFKSLNVFCNRLAKNGYRRTYGIFESEEEFQTWDGDFEHCTGTKNFAKDIGEKFKMLLDGWRDEKYLIGISYAHEQEFDNDREGVRLLNDFVDVLQQSIPEQLVYFDRNPSTSYQLHGNAAQSVSLEKYRQCKFFVILDDQYYDDSENCRAEYDAIKIRLKDLKAHGAKIERRLWRLCPKNSQSNKSRKEFTDKLKGYTSQLTKDSIESLVGNFIKTIEKYNEDNGR